MNWQGEAEKELQGGEKAEREGNSGRARVCARRAAGIALETYYGRMGENPGKDAMKLSEQFAGEEKLPTEVLEAVRRLRERVRPDFSSASEHPVNDARIVINFVRAIQH